MTEVAYNGGHALCIVIISADDHERLKALTDLWSVTRDWMARDLGILLDDAPTNPLELFRGEADDKVERFSRTDDFGKDHEFLLCHLDDIDVLFAASTRRAKNVPNEGSGNLSSNVVLEILRRPDGVSGLGSNGHLRRPKYGKLITFYSSRPWRTRTGAALITDHCADYRVAIVTHDRGELQPWKDSDALLAAFHGHQDAQEGDRMISKTSKHRKVAHENKQLKYARRATHPAVVVDRETGQMTYDLEVVEAIREAADMYLDGHSLDDIASKVAHRIPSYDLRSEPDFPPSDSDRKGSSRSERDAERRRLGVPQVGLKYLDDGLTPNPDYKPETIAHLADPGTRIRKLLLNGMTIPDPEAVQSQVNSTLEGLHPDDAYLEFYATGAYRRLHKDPDASTKSVGVYRWIKADLGPVEGNDYILTRAQVERLKERRLGRGSKPGPVGHHALTGLFRADGPDEIYTGRRGHVRTSPASGRWVFRSQTSGTKGSGKQGGYKICFERHDGSFALKTAWILAEDLTHSLIASIDDACAQDPELAYYIENEPASDVVSLPRSDPRLNQLEQEIEATQQILGHYQDQLGQAASELERQALEQLVEVKEARLASLKAEHDTALIEPPHEGTFSGQLQIGALVDCLAIALLPEALDPSVNKAVQHSLGRLIRDATITFEAGQYLQWRADLVFTAPSGQIVIPIAGRVENKTRDTWLNGVLADAWARRQPIGQVAKERGLIGKPGASWYSMMADRILLESSRSKNPIAGPRSARALALCPYPEVFATGMALLLDKEPPTGNLSDELKALLFAPAPEPPGKRFQWRRGISTQSIRAIIESERREGPAPKPLGRQIPPCNSSGTTGA